MQAPRPDLEAVLSSLTPRERQIVTYVAAGRPNKVIAIDLGISLRTVEAIVPASSPSCKSAMPCNWPAGFANTDVPAPRPCLARPDRTARMH